MVKEKERERPMKVSVNGLELKMTFDTFQALQQLNQNLDFNVTNYTDDSLEEKYGSYIVKCRTLVFNISKMLDILPSPDVINYADLGSAHEIHKHLDSVYDMLVSWTGFECDEDLKMEALREYNSRVIEILENR